MAEPIKTKTCRVCKQTKPFSEFHKNRSSKDGHINNCKVCRLIRIKEYSQTEKGKARYKRYKQTEKGKATQKRYRQSDKGRKVDTRGKKRFGIRHPEQIKAKKAVKRAIKTGKLPRPDTLLCHYRLQHPDCEYHAKQYHHWHGYAPEHYLDIVPVCMKCHIKQHNRKRSSPERPPLFLKKKKLS